MATREAKLVIRAIDQSAQAVKQAAQNVSNLSKATESLARQSAVLSKNADVSGLALERIAASSKLASRVLAGADAALQKIAASLASGKITAYEASEALAAFGSSAGSAYLELQGLGLENSKAAKQLDVLTDYAHTAAQEVALYGEKSEFAASNLAALEQAQEGVNRSFKELLDHQKALERFDKARPSGGVPPGRGPTTIRGALREAVPMPLRAVSYALFGIGAVVAMIDRAFKSSQEAALRLGRFGAAKSISEMETSVQRLSDAILTFKVRGEDAIGVMERASRATGGLGDIGTVALQALQSGGLATMLNVVGAGVFGGAPPAISEGLRQRVQAAFAPTLEKRLTDLSFPERKAYEEAAQAIDPYVRKVEGAAAAHLIFAQRVIASREALGGLSGQLSKGEIGLSEVAQATLQAAQAMGLSSSAIDQMRLAFGLVDPAALRLIETLRRIQEQGRATARVILEVFTIELLRALKEAGRTLPVNMAEIRASTDEELRGLVGALQKGLQEAADVTKEKTSNVAEQIREAARDSWLSMLRSQRDFRRQMAGLENDFNEKWADINSKALEKIESAQVGHAERLATIDENYWKRIQKIEANFSKARLRALIDRDARALFEAEESRNEGLAEAAQGRAEDLDDERVKYAERIQEAAEFLDEQRRQALADFDRRRAEALRAYQWQQQDALADARARIAILQGYNDAAYLASLYGYDSRLVLLNSKMQEQRLAYRGWYELILADRQALESGATGGGTVPLTGGLGGLEGAIYRPPRQNRSGGGFAYRQFGGMIPGSPGQAVPAVLHGGEAVVPADLVPALRRLAGGQFRVVLEVRGDGALAQLVRAAAYDAFIEVVS